MAQALDDAQGVLGIAARKQQPELLASHAGEDVDRTDLRAPARAEITQRDVAGGVAAAVVVGLEVVDVEQRDRERVLQALGVRERERELRVPGTAVGEARQGIGQGVRSQPECEPAALELVADEHRDVGERIELGRFPFARLVIDRAEAPEHMPLRRDDRVARVRDDVELGDREVRAQHGVQARVGDDERRLVGDDVLAEGVRQRRLAGVGPRLPDAAHPGEVLAVVGDERQGGDGRVRGLRRDPREAVEDRLRPAV